MKIFGKIKGNNQFRMKSHLSVERIPRKNLNAFPDIDNGTTIKRSDYQLFNDKIIPKFNMLHSR